MRGGGPFRLSLASSGSSKPQRKCRCKIDVLLLQLEGGLVSHLATSTPRLASIR